MLNQLADTLDKRRQADPETSYVASLYQGGLDRILKKVGEEASERGQLSQRPKRATRRPHLEEDVAAGEGGADKARQGVRCGVDGADAHEEDKELPRRETPGGEGRSRGPSAYKDVGR